MDPVSREDLAYAAGLIDGEGTIALVRHRATQPFRHPTITMASCSYELVDFMKKLLGGHISHKRTYREGHTPSFVWAVRHSEALTCLEKVAPFMREPEKLRRAHLILEEYPRLTLRNGRYKPEEIQKKLDFEENFFCNSRKSLRS